MASGLRPRWHLQVLRHPGPVDAATIALGLATIASTIAGGIAGNPAWVVAGITPLLVAVAWNALADQRRLSDQLSQQSTRITVVGNIFEISSETLQNIGPAGWDVVRLYSPIGLWDPSPEKDQWLKDLADSMKPHNRLKVHVKQLRCVYALPPDGEGFRDYAWPRLKNFVETPNTYIHYWPPDKRTIPVPPASPPVTPDGRCVPPTTPGLGVVIFEHEAQQLFRVVFGLVTSDGGTGKPLTDGCVIENEPLGRLVRDWFDAKPFALTGGHVLRGRDPDNPQRDVDMEEAIKKVIHWYYRPNGAEPGQPGCATGLLSEPHA